jgi:hypothetical protein
MKISLLLIFLLFATLNSGLAQNLIGIRKENAVEQVKKEMKGFNLDNSSKNETFNYLKFLNSSGTKTLLVFFSKENISTHTRMVCDYSEFDLIMDDFKKKYKKTSKTSWEYSVGGEKFEITLEEKEWYFVLNTKKK